MFILTHGIVSVGSINASVPRDFVDTPARAALELAIADLGLSSVRVLED